MCRRFRDLQKFMMKITIRYFVRRNRLNPKRNIVDIECFLADPIGVDPISSLLKIVINKC